MARFRLSATAAGVELLFDDGGMNLLSSDALRELRTVVDSLAAPAGPRAPLLLFRSGRPGLFAAGADMGEMERFDGFAAMEFSRLGQETFAAIERLPMRTVALIDGDCYGGALDLALAFDVRLATTSARFSHPGARLGIVTGFGGTSRWRGLLEPPASAALFLANRLLRAEEAEAIGLIDRVIETDDDLPMPLLPDRFRYVKELSRMARSLSAGELLLLARRLRHIYFATDAI